MKNCLKVLLASLALVGCGRGGSSGGSSVAFQTQGSGSIIGGEFVQNGSVLAGVTVKIDFVKKDQSLDFCSGILIAQDFLITAGHCFEDFDQVASSRVTFQDGTHAALINHWVHPQYIKNDDVGTQYDFALVQFALGGNVHPVAIMAEKADDPADGTAISIAGYGDQSRAADADYGTLKTTKATMQNSNFTAFEAEINQLGDNLGACNGDSGGPGYFLRGNDVVVWGVDSRTSENAKNDDCGGFEIYSKISSVKPWILSTMRGQK